MQSSCLDGVTCPCLSRQYLYGNAGALIFPKIVSSELCIVCIVSTLLLKWHSVLWCFDSFADYLSQIKAKHSVLS